MNNERSNLIKFYNDCVSQGFTNYDDDYIGQKMEILARKHGLSFSNRDELIQCFKDGKKGIELNKLEEKKRQQQEKINNLKEHEDLMYHRNMEEYYLNGRMKVMSKIQKEINALQEESDRIGKVASFVYSSLSKKESDWATLGGIANGIAGPAAGVVTALNVQAENAQIREYNKNLAKQTAQLQMNASSKQREISSKINTLKNELSRISMAYLSNEKDVLKYLNYDNCEVYVSITGALHIEMDCWMKEDRPVDFPVQACPCVNGTLVAELIGLEDELVYGKVYMPFPQYGMRHLGSKVHLEGVDIKHKVRDFSQKYIVILSYLSNVFLMEYLGDKRKTDNSKYNEQLENNKKIGYKNHPEWPKELLEIKSDYEFTYKRINEKNLAYEYLNNYENEVKNLEREYETSNKKEQLISKSKLEFYKNLISKMQAELTTVEDINKGLYQEIRDRISILDNPQGIVEVKNNEL